MVVATVVLNLTVLLNWWVWEMLKNILQLNCCTLYRNNLLAINTFSPTVRIEENVNKYKALYNII